MELIVERRVLPATKHNANPFEGQGADGGVMVGPFAAHLLVISLGPGRFQARLGSELVKGLTHKGRAGEAPMNPFTLAAPHGNGGRSGETLHIGSVLKALAVGSPSGQQAGRQSLSRPGETLGNRTGRVGGKKVGQTG